MEASEAAADVTSEGGGAGGGAGSAGSAGGVPPVSAGNCNKIIEFTSPS